MRRTDGGVNWPEMHNAHANSCIWSSIYSLLNTTSSYLYVAVSKKRAAVLKVFNRSHKSKTTRPNSAAPPSHRELFIQRMSGFSDSRFLCCHLVEIKDVITPGKLTLFKHKSWAEQRIRCWQKCCNFKEICFSLRGRTQLTSTRWQQRNLESENPEVGSGCVNNSRWEGDAALFGLVFLLLCERLNTFRTAALSFDAATWS